MITSIDFNIFSISASLDDLGTKGSPGVLSCTMVRRNFSAILYISFNQMYKTNLHINNLTLLDSQLVELLNDGESFFTSISRHKSK